MKKAFTLIELLIVVAIIAILAAIAVPNFLEAQVRSKVSRAYSDMRTIATAMEAYAVDNNRYPPNDAGGVQSQFRLNKVFHITTPIAYVSSLPRDVFLPGESVNPGAALDGYQYFNYSYAWASPPAPSQWQSWGWLVRNDSSTFDIKGGCIKSWGPDAGKGFLNPAAPGDDGVEWAAFGLDVQAPTGSFVGAQRIYDPTNGTISAGDLARFVGAVAIEQQQ